MILIEAFPRRILLRSRLEDEGKSTLLLPQVLLRTTEQRCEDAPADPYIHSFAFMSA